MKKAFPAIIVVVAAVFGSAVAKADMLSSVWSTGFNQPNNGAFGTPGSVLANTVAAQINSGIYSANVSLAANNGSWFRTTGTPNGTNTELAPFFENNVPLTTLTFSSDLPLSNFDIIFHNLWHSVDGRINYAGNFQVTYENGTVVSNAMPLLRAINVDSPFATDFLGSTLQPTGLSSAFDDSNLLSMTGPSFNPGNGAPLGYYLYDLSHSLFSETQGSGIVSFDESVHGGITSVSFTWVGHTVGINTAFVGFAGTVSIPEPNGLFLLGIAGTIFGLIRSRK